jgi:excisionase family DNA binding protein
MTNAGEYSSRLFVSDRPLLTHQVARMLGVPVRTVRYWAEKQRISAYKDPQRPKIWLFPREAVLRYDGSCHA